MKHELRRIDPLRAANVGALVYGILMTAFSLIAVPFFLVIAAFAPSREAGLGGFGFSIIFLLMYPIMGLVMGWISGALSSVIYNFIIRWTGGLLVEFDLGEVSPVDAPV